MGIISFPLNAQDYTISILPFNSDVYDEYSPVYYKGDIVFCSNRKNSIFINYTDEKDNLPLLNLFLVEEVGRKEWGKAELFSKQFSSHFNEGPATFNGRGSEIYYSRNNDVKKNIFQIIRDKKESLDNKEKRIKKKFRF